MPARGQGPVGRAECRYPAMLQRESEVGSDGCKALWRQPNLGVMQPVYALAKLGRFGRDGGEMFPHNIPQALERYAYGPAAILRQALIVGDALANIGKCERCE